VLKYFRQLKTIPWQKGRVALAAEQDNRVKIPNGTAAVFTKTDT